MHAGGMEKSGNPNELLFRRKRRRWPRAVWVKEVEAFEDSGLSPEEYAAKRGFRVEALKRWLRVLGNAHGGGASKAHKPTTFLPVRVVSHAERPSLGGCPSARRPSAETPATIVAGADSVGWAGKLISDRH